MILKRYLTVPVLVLMIVAPAGTWGATELEHPYIHNTPRALGMGGADVAVGGHAGALFSNPAGLLGVRVGWHVRPLVASLGSTERMYGFARDLEERLDIDDSDEQRQALTELLADYRGDNLHGQGTVAPVLVWRGEIRQRAVVLGISWLGSVRFDARPRQGFGDDGVLSVDGRTLSGPVLSVGVEEGAWRLGFAVKDLTRNRLARDYSVRDLVEITSDDDRDFSDDFNKGRDWGIDVGLQYRFLERLAWEPRVGLVLSNIAGLNFGDAGRIPQTLDVGMAATPPLEGVATGVTLSVEYADVLHRIDADNDPWKRSRLGVRWQAWERWGTGLAFSAGLYQRLPTLGVELKLPLVQLSAATYSEEQGAYAGQDPERRYVIGLDVGF